MLFCSLWHVRRSVSGQVETQVLHKRAMAVLHDMELSPACHTIRLGVFTVGEIQTLVTAVLDTDMKQGKKLASVIWEMTAGLPLYAEQVSKTFLNVYPFMS